MGAADSREQMTHQSSISERKEECMAKIQIIIHKKHLFVRKKIFLQLFVIFLAKIFDFFLFFVLSLRRKNKKAEKFVSFSNNEIYFQLIIIN